MADAVVVALAGLIIAIAVHIAIIARWSGRIDVYIQGNIERIERAEAEIVRLRAARHQADGVLQRHEGLLRELTKTYRPCPVESLE